MKSIATTIAIGLLFAFSVSANAQKVTLSHADSLRIDSIERSYNMNEVVVQSQRKLISNQVDRVSYDVKADEESKTSTILQMLRKVPMVSVEADGTVKVNGSTNFVIFKNGKPNKTMQTNSKDVLAAIPASSIKKIEVITEPGAKYDAEGIGAILNIVTDKSVSTSGLMGSVSVKQRTTSEWPSGNIWLSGQTGKFAASLVYGYQRQSEKENDITYELESNSLLTGNKSRNETFQKNPVNVHYFNFESSLDLGLHDLITAEFGGYTYNVNVDGGSKVWQWDRNGKKIMAQRSVFSLPNFSYWDVNGSLNYQHTTKRQGEMLNLAYRIATTDHHRVDNIAAYDSLQTVQMFDAYDKDEQLNFIEHTFEADWTRPLWKGHTLDIGAKYILRNNDSDSKMTYYNVSPEFAPFLGQQATDFRHTTNIAALYAEYRYNFQKWGFRAGLRYEYSHLKSEDRKESKNDFSADLNDFVPTFGASYRLTDFSMLKFNYSRRIQRPGISFLNPYVENRITQKSYGNPNLKSAGSNSATLSYQLTTHKLTFMPNINLTWANGEIGDERFAEQLEYEGNVIDVMNMTFANNIKHLSAGPSLYVQWQATNTTSIMANLSASWQQFKHKSLSLSNSRWGYNAWTQIRQRLPWKLTAEASGWLTNGGANSLYEISKVPFAGGSVALRRDFLKENRLSVALQGTLHKKLVQNTETVQGDSRGWANAYMNHNSRLELSLSYRFGSLRTSVKKTAKKIDNDDQIGGISKAQSNQQ